MEIEVDNSRSIEVPEDVMKALKKKTKELKTKVRAAKFFSITRTTLNSILKGGTCASATLLTMREKLNMPEQ